MERIANVYPNSNSLLDQPMIGIVDRKGSFSDRWIEECNLQDISFVLIDPFKNDIISRLQDVDGFLWHIGHFSPKEHLIAPHILYSCHKMGILTFPSLDTFWTFDDKVAQKYVLESIKSPHVKTEVFFDERSANEWAAQAAFPKVFKLRCGAEEM